MAWDGMGGAMCEGMGVAIWAGTGGAMCEMPEGTVPGLQIRTGHTDHMCMPRTFSLTYLARSKQALPARGGIGGGTLRGGMGGPAPPITGWTNSLCGTLSSTWLEFSSPCSSMMVKFLYDGACSYDSCVLAKLALDFSGCSYWMGFLANGLTDLLTANFLRRVPASVSTYEATRCAVRCIS